MYIFTVKIVIFAVMSRPLITVIISTYNQPKLLQKVLWSYEYQSFKDFEIVIADDGSTKETQSLIASFQQESELNIQHVWQEDKGFEKCKILNKAINAAKSDYLLFTDGDCIARKDFVQTHMKLRKVKHALSAGYFKLTESVSNVVTKSTIEDQLCFDRSWLLQNGQPKSFKMNKLNASAFKAWFLNTFTTTKATFDGMNTSCWKEDIVAVNGFDERMKYGGEDREVGERMMNNSIKFLQVRYSAICLHLYHKRPYKNTEDEQRNKQIRLATKKAKSTYTKFGLKQ